MNKKFIMSLSFITLLTLSLTVVNADTTIYTDNLGRMHFLGRDAANNTIQNSNYSNTAAQDLTKKLYEGSSNSVVNDTSYDQHPLKNYENTFPDSRFSTSNVWRTKYANNADDTTAKSSSIKATVDKVNPENPYDNGSIVKSSSKKHWWNRD